MISACPVRARVTARHITEHAEFAKVAEQGDKTQTRGTSVLRDLRALRFLRVEAGRAAGNAAKAGNTRTRGTTTLPKAPTPRTPHP